MPGKATPLQRKDSPASLKEVVILCLSCTFVDRLAPCTWRRVLARISRNPVTSGDVTVLLTAHAL
jgi:hypothetical protein